VSFSSASGERFDQRMLEKFRRKFPLRFAELSGRRRCRRQLHRRCDVDIDRDAEIVAQRRLKLMLRLLGNKLPGKNLQIKSNIAIN